MKMGRIKKGLRQRRLNLKKARERRNEEEILLQTIFPSSSSTESQPPHTTSARMSPPPTPSTSSAKRKSLLKKEADIPVAKQESIFVKKQSLEELASNVCCPECFEMMKWVFTRKHADSSFRIVCTKCAYVAKENVHDHKTKEKGM